MKSYLFAILVLVAVAAPSRAVEPADIFSDGCVLQHGQLVRIWGTAVPQASVTVDFAGQSVKTEADRDGRWLVTLQPLTPSERGQELSIKSSATKESVLLKDILVGEVWLAGGQSNMASDMARYHKKTQPDIDSANDALLRMVTVPRAQYPGHEVSGDFKWKPSTPENVAQFSATGYYFAKSLRERLQVPVGVISCNYGGTPAEAWMSRSALASTPSLKRVIDAYDRYVEAKYPDESAHLAEIESYNTALKRYNAKRKEKPSGKKLRKPKWPMGPRNARRPCGLYENMLTRTIPYTIGGTIWYQGENNANQGIGWHYRWVFSTLIEQWRADFKNRDMPFLFVQLATLERAPEPYWAELRESQKWVSENVPNTGMAVALDGGDRKDIHPHSKKLLGNRLALLARNIAYGEDELVCEGPRLNFTRRDGGKLVLTFDRVGSRLVLKDGGEHTFEVCGDDGVFVAANAQLVDQKVLVSAPAVAAPVHVRYGWHAWVVPTLFNAEGLPAGPFRSDDDPLKTTGNFYLQKLKPPVLVDSVPQAGQTK